MSDVQEINTFSCKQVDFSESIKRLDDILQASVVVAKENIIFHLIFCANANKNLFLRRHTAYTPNTRCTYLHWENAL